MSIALLAEMLGAGAFEVGARIQVAPLWVKLAIAVVGFVVALETSYA
ncbi:hypothetical protein [Marinicauda algicola]|nr:hypothetical protein [Marinicauda algicola]